MNIHHVNAISGRLSFIPHDAIDDSKTLQGLAASYTFVNEYLRV